MTPQYTTKPTLGLAVRNKDHTYRGQEKELGDVMMNVPNHRGL
jgi:hypothetical protein